ncbi:MAG: RNA polymerase sigma factor [Prevotellaceae bacterium]|jgi:RNA polymerase sigma-70 factor (ECF subfamily)|nr:RNA polymerase sigma factor [Prevotellaceae bacterium]
MKTHEISFRNDVLPLKNKLFSLALRITLDTAEAEDVVQETLIRVWTHRDEWHRLDSLEAYALTIARRLAIDRSRLQGAQAVALTPDAEQISDNTLTPYSQLVEKERWRMMQQLIESLPEKQRLTVQLRDIEGHSYKDVAAALNITEEQVKVNLFRGRQKLKQELLKIEDYGL